MNTIQHALYQLWHYGRWVLLAVLGFYALWFLYAVIHYYPTIRILKEIEAQKVTMADVQGEALPPLRTEAEYSATLAGLDENNNGIRDDVEHAILATTGDSLQMRAAKLQYAQALQLYFTSVRDSKTWVATQKKEARAEDCLGEILEDTATDLDAVFDAYLFHTQAISALALNDEVRTKAKSDKDVKFEVVYVIGSLNKAEACDVIYE